MSVESPSFHRFQEELAEKLQLAQTMGISDKNLASQTKKLVEWMEETKEPKTPEQLVLRELWQIADNREKDVLSNLLIDLVQHHHQEHQHQH